MRRPTAVRGAAALFAASVLLLAGCSSSSSSGSGSAAANATADVSSPARLTVSGGYIPQPPLADMAAAYVTVTDSGGTDAELVSVTTPLAAHVTLHSTSGATMRQVAFLPVPAHGSLTLGAGGDHLMLENLTHRPAVGEKVTLTLHFAHATPATTTVTVPVRPATYTPKG